MEELKSQPPCSRTVTIRRNPHRKARPTPSSAIPLPFPISSPSVSDIPSFPIQDILSIEVEEDRIRPIVSSSAENLEKSTLESLKVFLRIRPLTLKNGVQKKHGKCEGDEAKNAWPKNPKSRSGFQKKVKSRNETCLKVNDSQSVTLSPPQNLQDAKRVKSEVYEGFSHVFSAESSQIEVYDEMVKQLVEDFLNGKSGMLAALGPSGSGKTHTVFGCARNPGMVPLALRHIFSEDKRNGTQMARTFYLSIFEICSERGKSEKMYDLLREGVDLYLQQSSIKGLQEVMINDAQQAESLIACAMLKRATAMTNSNSQSSRSQCVINITYGPKITDGDAEYEPNNAVLTIVDLAGAEREKKTGNQGIRLLESNFINNTSMVFRLCLRSLLEHQKNPKRPLQKHFQSSLLTRYLRAYFEGKKRMALVLTVKPGEEDYLDTSNLLKQASSYTQIKFTSIEEPGNVKCSKRPIQTFPRVEQLKRMKFCELGASLIDERQSHGDELSREEKVDNANFTDILVKCEESLRSKVNGGVCLKKDDIELARKDRECEITLNFAKALWNVLKQYKMKLEMAENEICCLKDNIINEKRRCSDLENEVKELKRQSSNKREASAKVSLVEFGHNHSPDVKGCQSTEFQEGKFSSPAKASCTGAIAFKEQLSQHTGDHLECSHTHDNDNEISSASREVQTEDAITYVGGTDDLITLQTFGDEKCEEDDIIAGPGENLGHTGDHLECSHTRDNDNEISSASREFQTEDAITNVGDTDDLITLQTCGDEKCEEADIIAGPGENLGHLKDIEEVHNFSFSSDKDILVLKDAERYDACQEKEESDHSECATSFSQASASSSISETAVCSSSLLVVSNNEDQLPEEEHEEVPDSLTALKPEEDVSHACVPEPAVRCNSQCTGKPKRRLLPSSCILLKHIDSLAIEDESDKPKGARGEKKLAVDIRHKSKGSLSLLRLLRSDLHP